VLCELGIDRIGLARELDTLRDPGKMVTEAMSLRYSRNLKKTLAHAVREAKALNHRYVGTDHLLLGLLQLAEEPVAGQLSKHSLSLNRVRILIWAPESGDIHPPAPNSIS
jgi:ATP-dependent Clp protease ATP-binding subunit ClpC